MKKKKQKQIILNLSLIAIIVPARFNTILNSIKPSIIPEILLSMAYT